MVPNSPWGLGLTAEIAARDWMDEHAAPRAMGCARARRARKTSADSQPWGALKNSRHWAIAYKKQCHPWPPPLEVLVWRNPASAALSQRHPGRLVHPREASSTPSPSDQRRAIFLWLASTRPEAWLAPWIVQSQVDISRSPRKNTSAGSEPSRSSCRS